MDGRLLDRTVPSLPFFFSRETLYMAASPVKVPPANPGSTMTKEECNWNENIMVSPSLFQLKVLEDRRWEGRIGNSSESHSWLVDYVQFLLCRDL